VGSTAVIRRSMGCGSSFSAIATRGLAIAIQ
jgi:hypothetical protein